MKYKKGDIVLTLDKFFAKLTSNPRKCTIRTCHHRGDIFYDCIYPTLKTIKNKKFIVHEGEIDRISSIDEMLVESI